MKRRQLIRYAGIGFLSTAGIAATSQGYPAQGQSGGVTVKYLGHTCFLFSGGGKRILVNPFRDLDIGCTVGYRSPNVAADIVLLSSQLFDEGAPQNIPGSPDILFEPGSYQVRGQQFQGIAIAHDRKGGRQFGTNVAWSWTQGGVSILHLGGAAAPIEVEHKILMGRPDLAFVPVGGSEKAYNAREALQAVQTINPKIVVPTHYRTQAADPSTCDIAPVDEFLGLAAGFPVSRIGDTFFLSPSNIPQNGPSIRVMGYPF
ncbi:MULTISPECIES: MBL fold metallo-hydrolase [Spirulina sp. CCY15215]|uniref:MBL fold metallo-hydrolase n=1 Tax=Spirulina sp. CCY15215 TaxID=2767591 RepID=UPI001951F20F|nr:MBL fold metallo-hydrolase [Spirulina major]